MLGIAVEVCPAAAAPRATSRAGTLAAATPAVVTRTCWTLGVR